jgi:hypothetical protein
MLQLPKVGEPLTKSFEQHAKECTKVLLKQEMKGKRRHIERPMNWITADWPSLIIQSHSMIFFAFHIPGDHSKKGSMGSILVPSENVCSDP